MRYSIEYNSYSIFLILNNSIYFFGLGGAGLGGFAGLPGFNGMLLTCLPGGGGGGDGGF
jgi:hypothetical protein